MPEQEGHEDPGERKKSRRTTPAEPARTPGAAGVPGTAAVSDVRAPLSGVRTPLQPGEGGDDEEAARRAREKEQELIRAAWRRRLEEIRALIGEGKFPEAIQLAKRLGAEAEAPDAVTAEARRLGSEAEKRLADAFSATHWQPATNKVETKPPADVPPPERRLR